MTGPTPGGFLAEDRHWMAQALALGALAEGQTSPNPLVGCVVVRRGAVVGRGLHRALGQRHAESMALEEAGERAHGATLYVNLEPCDHHGRTPPCTKLVIESGVRRVVAAIQDPDPRVDGKGFRRLAAAGIQVDVGLMSAEAESLNDAFVHRHRTGRPLVTLKAALSQDGQIAAAGGVSRWISGSDSRRFAHRLRFRNDAILVGAETVRRDDPRLSVRLPGVTAPRLRVVLSPRADLDPAARLFAEAASDGSAVRIYCGPGHDSNGSRFSGQVEVVPVAVSGGSLDLSAVLSDLASHGIQSLLVEGGGRTFGAFLAAGLADRAAWFLTGKLLGAAGATPLLQLDSVERPDRAWRLTGRGTIPLGEDLLIRGILSAPSSVGGE